MSKVGVKPQLLLANGKKAANNQGLVNHITGDVHYIASFLPKKRTILTIHDLRPLFRGSLLKKKLIKLIWFTIPVRSVKYITVISEATKSELIKEVGVKPEKIRVIPNCLFPQFIFSAKEFNREKPRILHLGTKENKNLERLIMAIKGIPCHLRIIGKLSPEQTLMLTEHNVDYSNGFNLPSEQVVEEYRESDLISFVALYEGFGLPIIEAQATGRPVVTSNVSSMPEVAGESALLVDPCDVVEIRKGILTVIENKEVRERLVAKGLENVKRFRPEAVAAQYAEIYREILNQNK